MIRLRHNPVQPPRRRRGVFMLEMIGILLVLTVASVIAGEMFFLSFKLMRQTRDRDTLITRVDSAIDLMRRDAWSANGLDVEEGASGTEAASVRFREANGEVVWVTQGNRLTRTDAAGTKTWLEMPGLAFSRGPAGVLVVTVDAGPAGAARREHVSVVSPRIGGAP